MRVVCKIIFFLVLFGGHAMSQNSTVLKTKVDASVLSAYGEEGVELTLFEDFHGLKKDLPLKVDSCLFEAKLNGENIGFVYVGQAPSMKNVFDYVVIFDNNLTVIKTKVLIYREMHGRQIGSARWLSQFQGLNVSNRPSLESGIDGISGATISVNSMTSTMHDLLQTMDVLNQTYTFVQN